MQFLLLINMFEESIYCDCVMQKHVTYLVCCSLGCNIRCVLSHYCKNVQIWLLFVLFVQMGADKFLIILKEEHTTVNGFIIWELQKVQCFILTSPLTCLTCYLCSTHRTWHKVTSWHLHVLWLCHNYCSFPPVT